MAISRRTTYWMFQLGGWCALGLVNLATHVALQNKAVTARMALGLLVALSLGLASTHLFRNHVRRNDWVRLPPASLVPRILAAVIILAVAISLLLAAIHEVVPLSDDEASDVAMSLALILNWCLVLLGWNSIYFGVHYFNDYQRTRIEKWRLEAEVKEAELKALKSQLNPHFLFNSLNNLRGLILEDPERAQQVVTQLAAVLRYSLQTSGSTVPLEDELKMVRNYICRWSRSGWRSGFGTTSRSTRASRRRPSRQC